MTYAAQFLLLKPTVRAYRNYHLEKDIRVVYEEKTDTRSNQHSVIRVPSPIPNRYSYRDVETSNIIPATSVRPSSSLIGSLSLANANMKDMTPLEPLPPVTVDVADGNELQIDTYSVGVIITSTAFDVDYIDGVIIEAESPSGRIVKMKGDGLYHAQFSSDEIGTWKLSLYVNDKYIDACPVDVCDPSQVKVSGIRSGLAGKAQTFIVDSTKAGNGKVEVEVKHGRNRLPCSVHEIQTGIHRANFTPYTSGMYQIAVSFNRAEIRDVELLGNDVEEMQRRAVFNTTIKPEGDHYKIRASCDWQIDYLTGGPIHVSYGDASDIRVYSMQDGTICQTPHLIADCTATPEGELTVEVTHDGYRFPADMIEESPSVYRISFRPRGRGTYKVWLVHDGNMVKGSPFIQEIDELVSPSAYGDGLVRGREGEAVTFTVDGRGFPGTLTCSVDGPTRPTRTHIVQEADGTHQVTYYPEEIGPHLLRIKLDERNIEGSPFHPKIVNPEKVRVSGGWRSLMDSRERIPLAVRKEKHIPFDASDAGKGELTAEVRGPTEKIPVTVDSRGKGKHTLIFTPREEGKHYIDVYWAGFSLTNSPFEAYATYEPDTDLGAEGQSLISIRNVSRTVPTRSHNGPNSIELSHPYLEAYAMPIPIAMNRSPSTISRSTITSQPPRIRVTGWKQSNNDTIYFPKHPGSTYSSNPPSESDMTLTKLTRLSAVYKYNASETSNASVSSPTSSRAFSYMYTQPEYRSVSSRDRDGYSPKVVLSGKGLKEAHVNKPATFKVDGRKAGPGNLDVHLVSVRTDVPVKVQPIGNKQYRCSYVPPMPGAYLLDIKWNDRQLKCCPFKINVHNPVFPRKVSVMGEHLQGGVVGKDIHLTIDPREAGKGELKVKCIGPKDEDVPVKIIDNYDGTFSIKMKPQEPGEHLLEIKYNDEHVHGSPYVIVIRTRTNTGIVTLYGPGIHNGIMTGFEGHFWVDARGAGSGELHVSIMGPKGAFHVEMQRASQKDKLFHCRYNPHESGVYTINAQWSGAPIEGSPYCVHICNNESELKELMERTASPRHPSILKQTHHPEVVF